MTAATTGVETYDPKEQLDGYTYSEKFHWLQKWLWFCAGADVQLMNRCPRSEQIKEEGIGGIVLATAMLAFLSGSYAMYVVFGPKVGPALSPEQSQIQWGYALLSVILGLIWAAVILNIDRFVVSSTGHGDGTDKITRSEFYRALPRLAMAIIIGLCLAAPLEIRIMKTEIEARLTEIQMDKRNEYNLKEESRFRDDISVQERKKAEAEAKIRRIDENIRNRENNIVQQRKDLDDEASGRSRTGKSGEGTAYKSKLRNLEQMREELNNYRNSVREEMNQLQAEVREAVAAMDARRNERQKTDELNASKANNYDGLIKRIQIAHEVGGWTSFLLKLFLIVIEVAPIFFKMMMPRGPYLSLVDNQAQIALARQAIALDPYLTPGSTSTTAHAQERYHRAETIRAFEIAQLESERELARVALEANTQLKAMDIRANPEKYVDDNKNHPSSTT